MVDVICPQCATETRMEAVTRHADSFCPACDYPLFWAAPTEPLALVAGEHGPDHRRRLPGVAGRPLLATRSCWSCREENPADGIICVRCGADLDPPRVEAPQPAPVTVDDPVPPAPEPPRNAWLVVAGLLVFLVAVGVWAVWTL